MYSLTWNDSRQNYLVIGDIKSVFLIRTTLLSIDYIKNIKIRDISSGLEYDPLKGEYVSL